MPVAVYKSKDLRSQPRFGWRDAAVFVALFAVLYGVLHVVHGARAPYLPGRETQIDLSPTALPGYALRSLARMFAAFGASIVFTLVYGYTAAYNKRAEKVLVPLLDILQSIPVLGFLSVTVTGFMALFPNSVLGLECASVFAIFTGQAWNMTFSYYHSLKNMPRELREASTIYRLSWWQRLTKLEVPFSMIGLVWNGMMSFGGGWFFLAASEAITVLGKDIKLPGIGSYTAVAIARGRQRRGVVGDLHDGPGCGHRGPVVLAARGRVVAEVQARTDRFRQRSLFRGTGHAAEQRTGGLGREADIHAFRAPIG